MHWIGVFFHEGFGVVKNVEKAISYLQKAADGGNGQSLYQLYIIHSGKEGQDQSLKNPIKAYNYLMDAVLRGGTYWDELVAFFKNNYSELAHDFVRAKKFNVEVNESTEKDILNMHDAQTLESGEPRTFGKNNVFMNSNMF